jgi:hypothetical protein
MYKEVGSVKFPEYKGDILVNMMPFVFDDDSSIPEEYHDYLPLIDQCSFEKGKLAYLTIHESLVKAGISQRRPGIHTEGTSRSCWGGSSPWGGDKFNPWGGLIPENGWGGGWGGKSFNTGLYFASNDGSCRVWNSTVSEDDVNSHGTLLCEPPGVSKQMKPGTLYWLTDRTPHEALPVAKDTKRQFFRLVSHELGVWWAQHSTANPLGIKPDCKILTHSKF